MGLIISLVIAVFLIGTFSYLRPSRKMRFLSDLRLEAIKLGFKINNSMELKHRFKKIEAENEYAIYQLKNTSNIKIGHYFRENNSLELYDPIHVKHSENFDQNLKKINHLPKSILEIIFFEFNIAILWDEKMGKRELQEIHNSLNSL